MTDDPPAPAHEGPIEILDTEASAAGRLTARFVRYPGCQQLQLWLPAPDLQGQRRLRVQRDDGLVVDDTTVQQRLSGTVQLLFDTLPWPPGAYRLEIGEAGEAGELALAFIKRTEAPPTAAASDTAGPAPAAPGQATPDGRAPLYRDGWGRVIPDAAQALRDAALGQLQRRFSRRVHCHNQGRGGTVVYEERLPIPRRITFEHEIAGGRWHWWVAVPAPERWCADTGFALDERAGILQFVAESLQRSQGPGWAFTLLDDAIAFHDPR